MQGQLRFFTTSHQLKIVSKLLELLGESNLKEFSNITSSANNLQLLEPPYDYSFITRLHENNEQTAVQIKN